MAKWVTAIVQDRSKKACSVMASPGTDSAPAKPNSAALCGDRSRQGQEAKKQIHSLHTSFTPARPKNPPVVEVAKAPVSGGVATVDGEQVTVDGQTLKAITLSHSTGVTEDKFSLKIVATEIDGRWYVTDLRISSG
ncbi:hypothetical protein [Streptomyces sp. NPDC048636]|uniref:hypothetical protein n=1 Tax=Streptomyces sp. NPDC048636 TaxID=3155762 RepID=UPI003428581C